MDKENKNLHDQKNTLNKYLRFSTIAFQMIAIIGVFSFIGVWLDEKFPNAYSAYTVICALFGVAIAMYLVIKQVIQMNNDDN
ncbi:AtpZ/AtpI family protein [Lacinutrix undariae]